MNQAWKVIKRFKLFRKWAEFEDWRSEDSLTRGCRSRSAFERWQVQLALAMSERRTAVHWRTGKARGSS
jgi:hypothetical protein